jgi:GTP-binding protein Era
MTKKSVPRSRNQAAQKAVAKKTAHRPGKRVIAKAPVKASPAKHALQKTVQAKAKTVIGKNPPQKTHPPKKTAQKTDLKPSSKSVSGPAAKTLAPLTQRDNSRAGFVAIIGAPNAGKSTLLNRLIGEKVSIVSPKAQTTRMRILGIMTEGDVQVGFIDTPGIFAATKRMDRAMVQAAWNSLEDADAIVLLIDASGRLDDRIDTIIAELQRRHKRIILALNKTDAVDAAQLLPLTAQLNATGIVDDTFMISALTGDGVNDLKNHVMGKMLPSPWFYDQDQLSDLPAQLMAAEITREQLFRQLQQELPYAATVVPESWETREDGSAVVHQTILVARANHRSIVLGKGGARIKEISQASRQEMSKLLDQKIHLFLNVKTDEKWQDRPDFYKLFGLDFNVK